MAIKLTVKERKVIDEGAYLAKLVSVEEATGKYGDYLKFKFQIIEEGEFENFNINGLVGKNLQVGNKLFKWLSALNGAPIEPGDQIVIDEMVGNKCTIVISNQTDDDGNIVNRIDSVISYKKKAKPVAQQDEENSVSNKKKVDEFDETDNVLLKKKKIDAEFEDDEF